jgi:2-amino-4-hydroxy-6-hydroxymethyldihydropteridine diphosphokinase
MSGAELPAMAAIGLGSNLGDRRATIQSALSALHAHPGCRVIRVSSVIGTEPMGAAGQRPYLNAAALVETSLGPRELLQACQVVEGALGRRRAEPRWDSRTLDLDLLLYENRVIDEPGLRVPHPGLPDRLFALIPLAEIAEGWVHPERGVTIGRLLATLQGTAAAAE